MNPARYLQKARTKKQGTTQRRRDAQAEMQQARRKAQEQPQTTSDLPARGELNKHYRVISSPGALKRRLFPYRKSM
jgi:hypothetical protein